MLSAGFTIADVRCLGSDTDSKSWPANSVMKYRCDETGFVNHSSKCTIRNGVAVWSTPIIPCQGPNYHP